MNGRGIGRRIAQSILGILLIGAISGCSGLPFLGASAASVPPVGKIGLVAPFEGVYRATGYEALAAMRLAIQSSTANIELIPLALDSGGNPAQASRSLQKIAQEQALLGIVGPLLISASPPDFPLSLAPEVWIPQPGEPPFDIFLAEVAERSREAGFRGLLLAGEGGEEVLARASLSEITLPVRSISDPAQVGPQEGVIWLGSPEAGADFLVALRRLQPEALFWTALAGGDLVFRRRALAGLSAEGLPLGPIFWAAWLDEGYPTWAENHSPNSPLAYAVFRATQRLIAPEQADFPSRLYFFPLAP